MIGMRERVAVLDGTLAAGPKHGGGFEVRTVLPTSGIAATGEANGKWR